jgi:hypothetical protein
MKIDNIDKFWYVMRYQPHTNPQDAITLPRIRHNTRKEAEDECVRLSKAHSNAMYVVLEAIAFAKIPTADPIIFEILDNNSLDKAISAKKYKWLTISKKKLSKSDIGKEVRITKDFYTNYTGYIHDVDLNNFTVDIAMPGFITGIENFGLDQFVVKEYV